MALYINTDHFLEYYEKLRLNRNVNVNPYMDNALLNVMQMVQNDRHNCIIFDMVEIGGCEKCVYKDRPQKCSCCRRNRNMKDCYKENWQ